MRGVEVWARCQHIFQTSASSPGGLKGLELDAFEVLKPPEIPTDLPEDEYMDRKASWSCDREPRSR